MHREHQNFKIGETEGVKEYVEGVLPLLYNKFQLDKSQQRHLHDLAICCLEACKSKMASSLMSGLVEPAAEARSFWNHIGELAVSADSRMTGAHNLETALYLMAKGHNVLLISNHRSGADTLVLETLVNRKFGHDITQSWAYMSGHVVNLYLIPLMFTMGLRRFQIFSVKYSSCGVNSVSESDIDRQNMRALMCLRRHTAPGGRMIALYPEGGRGEGAMKRGEAKTTCIPHLMSSSSDKQLFILPTFVHDSETILPVARGDNEYNEIFLHAKPGRASLAIGEPIAWEDLQPSSSAITKLADSLPGSARESEQSAYQRLTCDTMMSLIANLAPREEEMGPYADPQLRDLGYRLSRRAANA